MSMIYDTLPRCMGLHEHLTEDTELACDLLGTAPICLMLFGGSRYLNLSG
jgi:hypothetical protein